MGSIKIYSSKRIINAIELATSSYSGAEPNLESTAVEFHSTVDLTCFFCSAQIPPAAQRCPKCQRNILWPADLQNCITLAQSAGETLPSHFSDGRETQIKQLAIGVATMATAARCLRESEFVSAANSWAKTILSRQSVPAESFGSLPALTGIGNQQDNAGFWAIACRLPQELFHDVNRDV